MLVDGALVTTSEATQWTSAHPSESVVLQGTKGPGKYVKVCPLTFNPEEGVPIKAGDVKYYELPKEKDPEGIYLKSDGTITLSEGYTDVTPDFIACFQNLNNRARDYNLRKKLIDYGPYDRRRYVHWMCVKSPDEPDGLNPVAILGWPMLDSISPKLILRSFDDSVKLASLLLQTKQGTAKDNIELLLSVTLRLYAGGYKSEPIDDRSFFYSMFSIPDYQCDCDDMSMIVAAVAIALKKATRDELAKFDLSDDAKEVIAYLQDTIDDIYVAHGRANTPQEKKMIGHVWVIMTKKPEPQVEPARDQQAGRQGVAESQQDVGQGLPRLPNFTDCLLIESTTSSAPNQISTKAAQQVGLQARCTFNVSGFIQNSEKSIRMLPKGYDYITIALYGVNEAYALVNVKSEELGVPYEKLTTGKGIECIPLHDFESRLSDEEKDKVEIVRSLTTKYSEELFRDGTDLRKKITSTLQSVPPGAIVKEVSAGVLVPGQFIHPSADGSSGVTFYNLFCTVSWAYKPINPAGDATLEVTS